MILAIVMSPAILAIVLGTIRDYRVKVLKLQLAAGQAPGQADLQAMHQLAETAQRLEQRVGYLERVLDAEAPGWRARGSG